MRHENLRVTAIVLTLLAVCLRTAAVDIHVATNGADTSDGTFNRPFATLKRAQDEVRRLRDRAESKTIIVHSGTYYLTEPLLFSPEDSGTATAPVIYAAAPGEKVVLSGGMKLALAWEPYRDGIYKAAVPDNFETDQLFAKGHRQPMARYPNFDPQVLHFNGYAPDAFSPERASRWAHPRGGYIHAMHRHEWGDFHYLITGKDAQNRVAYEGGWQNNRRLGMHDRYRMVENIFEELDAPGEWFHDKKSHTLYFYPPAGIDIRTALVEGVRLQSLIEFRGSADKPVRFISVQGLSFQHAARTFMQNREPLLRSDWTIYRGGAILFAGTENCSLSDCTIDQVGGNAVFINNYNRRLTIRGCHIFGAGANGVSFVGNPEAVRNPLFEYQERQRFSQIDKTPGPKSNDYPADCLVEDCLIHETGRVEKQTAPIEIAMAQDITIRHCSLYDVPRAGINIGDGCWGGHVIEFCDIFDTVKETGDHGSFNSWGRDRYWGLEGVDLNAVTTGENRDLPRLDVVKPVILRNNRWRCDHGWDIDLDDGSTNYEIRNNLCLNGGIKLREGFYRVCENNIMVNNSFHPHVWYRNSQDVFRYNIVFSRYKPIEVRKPWGQQCDYNLLHVPGKTSQMPASVLQQQSGLDEHSVEADAFFVDPAHGDYRVTQNSPALALGFKNFPMDQFGVQKPHLKALAKTPVLPGIKQTTTVSQNPSNQELTISWLGAKGKNLSSAEEVSATGLYANAGVLLVEVPANSEAARAGLRPRDVILGLDGKPASSERLAKSQIANKKMILKVWRDQKSLQLEVPEHYH